MKNIVSHVFDGTPSRIVTPVKVYNPFTGQGVETGALWDTGATCSAVSKNLSEFLKLKRLGKMKVDGSFKSKVVDTHYINLYIGKDFKESLFVGTFENKVTTCIDVIIGMDIINKGDLIIGHYDGKTHFSFQIYSK